MNKPFIIALDGPAASGKGTLAGKISAHYQLPHLDTGLTYRSVAQTMMRDSLPLDDETSAVKIAQKLDLSQFETSLLRSHEIGEVASKIAVFPLLRQALVEVMRNFANQQPLGAVLDGRDIGTVVCPDAQAKIYVTASRQIRAKRRTQEIISKGGKADFETILADLTMRDERDMNRPEGALKQAVDAYLLDTSKLTIEEALHAACHFIDHKRHLHIVK